MRLIPPPLPFTPPRTLAVAVHLVETLEPLDYFPASMRALFPKTMQTMAPLPVCPHWGCRYRAGSNPGIEALGRLPPAGRLLALTKAGILRPSVIRGHDCRLDWLLCLLGCSAHPIPASLPQIYGTPFEGYVRRVPDTGPNGQPQLRHLKGWLLGIPHPTHQACPICGREATPMQSLAQQYPPQLACPLERMRSILRGLATDSRSHLPVAWLAAGVGLSPRKAAKLLRGAGFDVGLRYCSITKRPSTGVRGYVMPQE